jgi:hypothetical protein
MAQWKNQTLSHFCLNFLVFTESPLRNTLSHAIQPSITILADRANRTHRIGQRTHGSLTVGRRDLVNCREDYQYVTVQSDQNDWTLRMMRFAYC